MKTENETSQITEPAIAVESVLDTVLLPHMVNEALELIEQSKQIIYTK